MQQVLPCLFQTMLFYIDIWDIPWNCHIFMGQKCINHLAVLQMTFCFQITGFELWIYSKGFKTSYSSSYSHEMLLVLWCISINGNNGKWRARWRNLLIFSLCFCFSRILLPWYFQLSKHAQDLRMHQSPLTHKHRWCKSLIFLYMVVELLLSLSLCGPICIM